MRSLQPVLLALFLLASTSANAVRYHVNASATGNGTGLTWANAYTDLQAALSVVIPGDEIWVAAGQYKPTSGTSRTIAFTLRNGVNVFGGFSGVETSIDQRDIASNPTTLSGDIGNLGENGDNSHSVVKANGINTSVTLDGFRIMSGYSASGSGYHGGGLNVQNCLSGNLLLRNCVFVNNYSGTYGGAIYMAAANLTIENCEFISNRAGTGGDGGAIYNGNNNGGYSTLVIRDCVFKSNSGRRGACIHGGLDFVELFIDRCVFTNNTSPLSIFEIDGFDSAVVQNSYIIGNTVDGSTSNVFRVVTSAANEVMTFRNCTISNNYNQYATPQSGSEVIRVYGTNHRMVNSIIHGNSSYAGRQVSASMGISTSIVQGGHASGTDIIDADPQFVSPYAGAPGNFDASGFDYTLLPSSPGINVGDNAAVLPGSDLDLNGNVRIQGGVVDLGCYESELSVGLSNVLATESTWYFDVQQSSLHLRAIQPGQANTIEIFNSNGQLVQRISPEGHSVTIHLPAGMYVARSTGRAPLKFVTAPR